MEAATVNRRPSAEEINAMPLRHYDGRIVLVRSLADWRNIESELASAELLGFDTETRPTFRKGKQNPPSLIQLATEQAVFLIQLSSFPFSAPCAEILANPKIVKAGVGIAEDMAALARINPFQPAGLADLGLMARSLRIPCQGLRTLAASLFGWRISKGLQCSNWSLADLSPKQISYAATDAWIGRLIYLRLLELAETEQGKAPSSK